MVDMRTGATLLFIRYASALTREERRRLLPTKQMLKDVYLYIMKIERASLTRDGLFRPKDLLRGNRAKVYF